MLEFQESMAKIEDGRKGDEVVDLEVRGASDVC